MKNSLQTLASITFPSEMTGVPFDCGDVEQFALSVSCSLNFLDGVQSNAKHQQR